MMLEVIFTLGATVAYIIGWIVILSGFGWCTTSHKINSTICDARVAAGVSYRCFQRKSKNDVFSSRCLASSTRLHMVWVPTWPTRCTTTLLRSCSDQWSCDQWSCEEEKVSKCQFQARSVKTIIVPAKPYKQDDTLYEIVRWSDECAETNHY